MHKDRWQQLLKDIREYFTMKGISKSFTLLSPFFLKHRKAYLVLFFLLGLDIFLTIAFAVFLGDITDAAVRSDFKKIKSLVPTGIFLVSSSIISSFIGIYFETAATNGVKRDLKNHIFSHYLRLPTYKANNLRSGELISHLTNDIHSLDGIIGYSLILLIRLPIIFIVVFIYLIQINMTLTLLSLLVTPIALTMGIVFGFLLRNNSRTIHRLVGRINNHISETFQGISVIRSFTLEKLSFKEFTRKNEDLYQLELKNAKLRGWFSSGGSLVSSITFYVCLILGAYYVSKDIMTVGSLLTFVNLVNHLVYPLTGLAAQWARFQRSIAAVERLVDVLEEPVDSDELPAYTSSKPIKGMVHFQNITFNYDNSNKVFKNFNLSIPAGKVVAIVGPSGAGKSTLFGLLQRFYKPQSGTILIDGVLTNNYTLSELRSSIAIVSQETFLFAGTIKENLLIARPDAKEEEMIAASKNANIHDFIMGLPDKYETEIGERGVNLSGGQKQRLAIARAILKNAPILLLDEATSALDSETEFHVKEALEELMKGRTTLVIAHRLSTVQNADLIYVLDKGELVQMGKHEDLIHTPGLYQSLYQVNFQSKKGKVINMAAGE